ncbi:hypothetical protein [Pantoea anthophila]|uniref:hypothetical protein n=1 Tax=Pantoea anthophila TaxID=470931 RepID=UPI00301CD438
MRTAHDQHAIPEHQRLVYTCQLPDKVQDISSVQRVGIVCAFDNTRCMRRAIPFKLAVLHPEQAAQLDATNDKDVSNKHINTLIRDALIDFSLELKIRLPILCGAVLSLCEFNLFWDRLWIKYWI